MSEITAELLERLYWEGTAYNMHADWRMEPARNVIERYRRHANHGATIVPYADIGNLVSFVVVIPDRDRDDASSAEAAEGFLYVVRMAKVPQHPSGCRCDDCIDDAEREQLAEHELRLDEEQADHDRMQDEAENGVEAWA